MPAKDWPRTELTREVQDAREFLTHLPLFFLFLLNPMSIHKIGQPLPLQPSSSSSMELDKGQREKVRNAAQLYEKQFLGEMVKAMRKTVDHSRFTKPSMPEEIYMQQLDEKYVEAWGDNGGIGLADIIYDQLMERFEGLKHRGMQRPQGPLPIAPREGNALPLQQQMEFIRVQPQGQDMGFLLRPKAGAFGGKVAVTSPWNGSVERVSEDGNGRQALWVQHDNGLRSVLSFKGKSAPLTEKQPVLAGETLGEISVDEPDLAWTVTNLGPEKA